MRKMMILALAILMVGYSIAGELAAGEAALLQIDADDNGQILEVRDRTGSVLTEAPFEGVDGFDFLDAKSLLLGEVVGEAARCCKVGDRWYNCLELATEGKAWTIMISDVGNVVQVDGYVDGEWTQDVQPVATGEPIKVAEIRALKSHAIAIVEKEGTRYGMVISPDLDSETGSSIWYNEQEF